MVIETDLIDAGVGLSFIFNILLFMPSQDSLKRTLLRTVSLRSTQLLPSFLLEQFTVILEEDKIHK